MADGVFNIALGSVAEQIRDAAANVLMLMLESAEADGTLEDHDDLAALLSAAGNTEAAFTNYARQTGITGTVTVDDSNNRVDVDAPDQTINSAGNGTNETLAKVIFAYENSASDSGRVPQTHHDFTPTTDGSALTVQLAASGYFRAS